MENMGFNLIFTDTSSSKDLDLNLSNSILENDGISPDFSHITLDKETLDRNYDPNSP